MLASALPATISAWSVLVVGAPIALGHHFGSLSTHMAVHIVLMNVAAPLAAGLLVYRGGTSRPLRLWTMALIQIGLLWAWHAPPVHREVMGSELLQAFAHVSLFVTAFYFWGALLHLSPTDRWQAIPVLLLTGKLFCLLAVLMIFAPRLLYESHASHAHGVPDGLADQQLAGLLMVATCPLSYLVAGVILAAQIIRRASSGAIRIGPTPTTGL